MMKTNTEIKIVGARQHNLKNIDVSFPKNSLVIITGLSGSGKSSLAFDTLYAEGQRRYVESLSTYARQFLGRMEKPDVDSIEGLSPAIAIEQKSAGHNPRSTVGTVTEIYDYLRLLYARAGDIHCHQCGKELVPESIDQIMDTVMGLPEGSRVIIIAPLRNEENDELSKQIKRLKKEGFARLRVDGNILEIDAFDEENMNGTARPEVVIDRIIIKETVKNRLADSIELALAQSGGTVIMEVLASEDDPENREMMFTEKAVCTDCDVSYPDFTPASFSFNSPHGACPACDGLGTRTDFSPELIVPNPELSLREGAVLPWKGRESMQFFEFLDALTSFYKVNMNTPYKGLPAKFRKTLMYGSGKTEIPFYFEKDNRRVTYKKTYEGIITGLKKRAEEKGSASLKDDIKQYMHSHPCSECVGARLNNAGRSVTFGGITISDFTAFSISDALEFIDTIALSGKKQLVSESILIEIKSRLGFLFNVGLKYLTLNRSASTLSGGETQRIRLATQIGSKLTGVLYVLDEPSIGLHQRDNLKLLATLKQIRDAGNTVLVVEHDDETILSSDYILDIGPGAGMNGGNLIFAGTPDEILKAGDSLTGQYLSGKKKILVPGLRRSTNNGKIVINGARANNLKNIDVEFPVGCFTCVTGVSGSGKSTLVFTTLYRVLSQRLYSANIHAGDCDSVSGLDHIDKVIHINQAPIGKTPRSNPVTYTGAFSHIRELFSKTTEARSRGYKSGRFSFNVKGGRCEACTGDGIIKIEMHFLPDVYVPCDVCKGKRYNRETLEVKYKGENISDVLDMTVNQALLFFENVTLIREKLETIKDAGIGYIHLGQPATTLSGGEAQRLKIAKELGKKSTGRTIYLLDEPTTGLHTEDINRLLMVLNRLVDSGNTLVVIEHNLDVIKSADYVIDIGPEGGDEGGYIVGCGTPEAIVEIESSYTGKFLKNVL